MPPRYNHPARVAERISHARPRLRRPRRVRHRRVGLRDGAGRLRRRRARTRSRCGKRRRAKCVKMMTETPYAGVEGAYFGMPQRNVIPKPLQKPHPPLWVASSRRETTMVAARLGMGSLGFAFETPDEAEERARAVLRAGPRGVLPDRRGDQPGAGRGRRRSRASTRDEEAIEKGMEGAQFFAYSLAYYYNPFTGGSHKPGQEQHLQARSSSAPETSAGVRSATRSAAFGGFGGGDTRRRGAGGRGHSRPLARRPARRLHRHAGLHQGHAAQVRGGAPGPDDLRRAVRRPQARGRDGLDLPHRHEGDPGVQGAPRRSTRSGAASSSTASSTRSTHRSSAERAVSTWR